MLAGVGPVRLVLFVVAADEGWKPQSEEHLAIVDVLGVDDAVVALTKRDLVDDETAPDARDAGGRRATRSGTALARAPVVAVLVGDRRGDRRARRRARRDGDDAPDARARRPAAAVHRPRVHHRRRGDGRHRDADRGTHRRRRRRADPTRRGIAPGSGGCRRTAARSRTRAPRRRASRSTSPGPSATASNAATSSSAPERVAADRAGRGEHPAGSGARASGDRPRRVHVPRGRRRTAAPDCASTGPVARRRTAGVRADRGSRGRWCWTSAIGSSCASRGGARPSRAGSSSTRDPPRRPGAAAEDASRRAREPDVTSCRRCCVAERGAVREPDVAVLTGVAPGRSRTRGAVGAWWVKEDLCVRVAGTTVTGSRRSTRRSRSPPARTSRGPGRDRALPANAPASRRIRS